MTLQGEINIPIKAVDYVDQDIQIIWDDEGIQLNIIYDGMCTHRVKIDKNFLMSVHDDDLNKLFEYDFISKMNLGRNPH